MSYETAAALPRGLWAKAEATACDHYLFFALEERAGMEVDILHAGPNTFDDRDYVRPVAGGCEVTDASLATWLAEIAKAPVLLKEYADPPNVLRRLTAIRDDHTTVLQVTAHWHPKTMQTQYTIIYEVDLTHLFSDTKSS